MYLLKLLGITQKIGPVYSHKNFLLSNEQPKLAFRADLNFLLV